MNRLDALEARVAALETPRAGTQGTTLPPPLPPPLRTGMVYLCSTRGTHSLRILLQVGDRWGSWDLRGQTGLPLWEEAEMRKVLATDYQTAKWTPTLADWVAQGGSLED